MLKKITTLVLMSTLVAGVAQARHHGGFMPGKDMPAVQGGGFQGPGIDIMSVKDVLNMKDDARVRLKGQIEKSLGSEQYLFKDSTGTIEVEIDDKKWMGQTVTPNDTVEIYGELDKELIGAPEVDVKRIQLVK